ncbi:transposase [Microbulbifer thermotolerans]|nr:transposase [Microbulbifer thermotolerans]
MTKKTRKNYTSEFLQDAVRLVAEQGYMSAAAVEVSVWTPACWAGYWA